ncbi:hypothetical protein Tco_1574286, partial [Tanacetum coccineum]
TEGGKHIHLTEEQINQQKKIEEEAKSKAAKHEREVRKAKLVDLLGPEVGLVILKVYREDGTSEVIPNFKASDLYLGPGLDDHDRSFSSLLLAEVDKRNLNPLKQVRFIEQLRVAEVYSSLALQVLRRLGSIFTSVYAAVQKLKKKLKRVVSLLEGLQGGKKIALCQKE